MRIINKLRPKAFEKLKEYVNKRKKISKEQLDIIMMILINEKCHQLRKEMTLYSWDEKAAGHGDEKPVKEYDHSADALRYYVNSLPKWRIE